MTVIEDLFSAFQLLANCIQLFSDNAGGMLADIFLQLNFSLFFPGNEYRDKMRMP